MGKIAESISGLKNFAGIPIDLKLTTLQCRILLLDSYGCEVVAA